MRPILRRFTRFALEAGAGGWYGSHCVGQRAGGDRVKIAYFWVRQKVRDSLLFVPMLMLIVGIALAVLSLEVDERWRPGRELPFVFGGGVEAARPLLATIATATLTAATLVFSITMLVLQLASGQFSPRLLGSFLRDRYATYSMGLFAATFAFALVVLANTDSPQDDDTRRSFATSATAAFVLVLLSVGGLVAYVNHTAQSIRVSSILGTAARDTARAIETLYPEGIGDAPGQPVPWEPTGAARGVLSRTSGVITAVDDNALFGFTGEKNVAIALQRYVGEFVAEGTVLMIVYGSPEGDARDDSGDDERLCSAVLFNQERTIDQDAAFGFRQLVDIASRALSPGVNDPTTAVQALDQVFAALLKLGRRTFPSEVRLDDDGQPRLLLPRHSWEYFVRLGLDEIIEYGRGSSQVRQRLHRVFDELESALPTDRRDAIREQRDALHRLSPPEELAHTD